jgi:hypothetical protein
VGEVGGAASEKKAKMMLSRRLHGVSPYTTAPIRKLLMEGEIPSSRPLRRHLLYNPGSTECRPPLHHQSASYS